MLRDDIEAREHRTYAEERDLMFRYQVISAYKLCVLLYTHAHTLTLTQTHNSYGNDSHTLIYTYIHTCTLNKTT